MPPDLKQDTGSPSVHDCNATAQLDAQRFESAALAALKANGFRITMPRVQVIRTLAGTNAALSPQAIHERILMGGGRIDAVSVYRILSTLENVGLVHHIGIVDGYFACRQECAGAHRAQYLVCSRCGCVSEVPIEDATVARIDSAAGAVGFSPGELRIEQLGHCSHCRPDA